MVSSVLSELKVGDFIVKVSHRKLLDAMLTFCGVPKEKFHPICSAIDKLDKEPWVVVRAEMVDQKGLPAEVRFLPSCLVLTAFLYEMLRHVWAGCSAGRGRHHEFFHSSFHAVTLPAWRYLAQR